MKLMHHVTDHVAPLGASDSLFVTCASYEERTMLGVRRLAPSYKTQFSIICRSEEYKDKGSAPKYFEQVHKGLRSHSMRAPQELYFKIDEPIGFLHEIDRLIQEFGPGAARNVTVDISTFPRQELLILLRYLDLHQERKNLRLLYAEPKKYATETRKSDDRWLTRGVRGVSAVPGFCGIQYPQLAKLLVTILGHEGERTHITLRRHQPDKAIFLGQGKSQYHKGLKEIAEKENRNMVEQFGTGCFWKNDLPAHGILETKEAIEAIYQENRYTHNLFVAPNGTKLQLVGVYLAARENLEIQITYATPAIYNFTRYTKGTGKLWEIRIAPRV